MKFTLPIILVVITAGLMALALVGAGHAHGTVGIAAGSAIRGLTPKASTPEQALTNLLVDLQRRNWDRAFAALANSSGGDEQSFVQDWLRSNGRPRPFSNIEGFESRPPHATSDDDPPCARLDRT